MLLHIQALDLVGHQLSISDMCSMKLQEQYLIFLLDSLQLAVW